MFIITVNYPKFVSQNTNSNVQLLKHEQLTKILDHVAYFDTHDQHGKNEIDRFHT